MAPEGRRYRLTGCGGGERRSGAASAHERTAWGRSPVPLGTARLPRTSGPLPIFRLVCPCPHSGTRSSFPDHDQTVCCAHARGRVVVRIAQRCYFKMSLLPLCAPSPTPESSQRRLFSHYDLDAQEARCPVLIHHTDGSPPTRCLSAPSLTQEVGEIGELRLSASRGTAGLASL